MSETTTPFSLAGSVVVQCGGSGLLGGALAMAISQAGATLVVASRQRDALDAVAARARTKKLKVEAAQVDIGSEESILALRDGVLARHGRIDGFVFNAVSRPMRGLDDTLSAWSESMATNATGMFATLRAFGQTMVTQQRGSIVAISSIQGMVGSNPWLYEGTTMSSPPDYYFHKAGMINLARHLASHFGAKGVRVNVVSPGGIHNSERPQAPEFRQRYDRMTMLGRMAEPHEVGGAVVFLLSEAASYITGINLPVDGGYTAK